MSRFYCFNGFDLESCHNLDQYHSHGQSSHEEKVERPTGDDGCACGIEEEPLYTKSTTMLVQDYEISFENGFMNEHNAVLEKELQNYMEFVRTCISKKAPQHLSAFQNEENALRPRLNTEDLIMLYQLPQSNAFLKALSTYEKLKEFLDTAVAKLPNQASMELVSIAQQMLAHYEKHKDNIEGSADLLELSADKAPQLTGIKLINLGFIDLGEDKLEAERAYKKFLEVFSATCLLVTAQYFENPYHKEGSLDALKRPLSPFSWEEEDQESFEGAPSKKRKFSF